METNVFKSNLSLAQQPLVNDKLSCRAEDVKRIKHVQKYIFTATVPVSYSVITSIETKPLSRVCSGEGMLLYVFMCAFMIICLYLCMPSERSFMSVCLQSFITFIFSHRQPKISQFPKDWSSWTQWDDYRSISSHHKYRKIFNMHIRF